MALDKLVDSNQLDSDLTSVANAIRAKSGGSSQLVFPAGFVSEIGNIPSGGGALHGVTRLFVYSTDNNHTEVAGIFPDLETLDIPSANDNTLEKIDLQSNKTVSIVNGCSSSNKGGALREINLHMGQAIISSAYGLRYRENLETVLAKCVVTTSTTINQFTGAGKLKTIYFLENAQDISVNISACPLDDASLVSLANGLKLGATSSTLTLSAAAKSTAQAMLGTVSTVGSGADAYDLFTPDAAGSTTLAQFITTTKGWTIA